MFLETNVSALKFEMFAKNVPIILSKPNLEVGLHPGFV
jgi:hypothetical protein